MISVQTETVAGVLSLAVAVGALQIADRITEIEAIRFFIR
jgi:hypothetical protein